MVVLESLRHQTVRNSDSLQSNFYKELQWPDFPVLHCVLEFPLTHVRCVMPSNCLILCSPLLLLPSIFPNIWFFSNESAFRIRWQKYWSFSTSSSNEYSELISISIDWFDPPCCPRDSQESFPAPQFEGIDSSAFCLLYHPVLTTGMWTPGRP